METMTEVGQTMPYAFRDKDRSVQKGTRRIALEQIDRALASLDEAPAGAPAGALPANPPSAETIHGLRTTVKKLRGLVRLVRPGFAAHRDEDRALRDAARAVSAQRDSAVMLATLNGLAPEGLPALRAALSETHGAAHAAEALDEGLVTYRVTLLAVRERARRWKIAGKGFATLGEGIEDTFRAARRAHKAVHRQRTPEALHEWRKAVKAHGYQTRLLAPIWPAMMAAHQAAVDELGETLGLVNDLSVFTARIGALDIPEDERSAALALAADRRAALIGQVLPLGDRLFAERPQDIALRWGRWWALWRDEAG